MTAPGPRTLVGHRSEDQAEEEADPEDDPYPTRGGAAGAALPDAAAGAAPCEDGAGAAAPDGTAGAEGGIMKFLQNLHVR